MLKESLCVNFITVLGVVAFMHNALTSINSHTPYQALLGCQPHLLPPLEGGYHGDLSVGGQNDLARARGIAAVAIIEAIAKARPQRGDYHKMIAAQERAELQAGDLVDIWYDPQNEDTPGWRGLAQIASVNFGEGNLIVRFQGRTLDRRHQEVRVHVPYLVFTVTAISNFDLQFSVLRREVENITIGFVTLGVVQQQGCWHLITRSKLPEGNKALRAGLMIATNALHLERVACVRVCRGISTMPALNGVCFRRFGR